MESVSFISSPFSLPPSLSSTPPTVVPVVHTLRPRHPPSLGFILALFLKERYFFDAVVFVVEHFRPLHSFKTTFSLLSFLLHRLQELKMHRIHRRQFTTIPPAPTDSGFLSIATTIGSTGANSDSLLLDASATATSGLQPVLPSDTPFSSVSPDPSSISGATESGAESDSIPIGTVIGICVGVFAGLAILLLLVYRYVSRRSPATVAVTGREAERRKSGRELWVKMEDQDGNDNFEKYAIQRTTMTSVSHSDGTGATAVGRSITVKSAKSSKTFKSLGYGTNLGLSETFKTPDLPPQLEFTDAEIGTGRSFVGSGIVTVPFARQENQPISWDGDTVAEGQSYLSLNRASGSVQYAEVRGPVSPQMVVSHQTPPATETQIPRWERAEVVSPDGSEAYAGFSEPRHPYAMRSSQETIRNTNQASSRVEREVHNPFRDQNPFDDPTSRSTPVTTGASDTDSFFTTKSDLTVRTGAFAVAASAVHHERADSNERAMASLIAALNITQEEARERLSAAIMPTPRQSQSSSYSLGLQSDESKDSVSLDEASFKQFPLPPTTINNHHAPS